MENTKLNSYPYCTWCKKIIGNDNKWSENKEPLCCECSDKYYFGLGQGLITGKISELTKEQRGIINSKWRDNKYFRHTMRSIKNTELIGGTRVLSGILATTLVIIFLFGSSYLIDLIQKMTGLTKWVTTLSVGWAIIPTLAIISLVIYAKINWQLRLYQLKKVNNCSNSFLESIGLK